MPARTSPDEEEDRHFQARTAGQIRREQPCGQEMPGHGRRKARHHPGGHAPGTPEAGLSGGFFVQDQPHGQGACHAQGRETHEKARDRVCEAAEMQGACRIPEGGDHTGFPAAWPGRDVAAFHGGNETLARGPAPEQGAPGLACFYFADLVLAEAEGDKAWSALPAFFGNNKEPCETLVHPVACGLVRRIDRTRFKSVRRLAYALGLDHKAAPVFLVVGEEGGREKGLGRQHKPGDNKEDGKGQGRSCAHAMALVPHAGAAFLEMEQPGGKAIAQEEAREQDSQHAESAEGNDAASGRTKAKEVNMQSVEEVAAGGDELQGGRGRGHLDHLGEGHVGRLGGGVEGVPHTGVGHLDALVVQVDQDGQRKDGAAEGGQGGVEGHHVVAGGLDGEFGGPGGVGDGVMTGSGVSVGSVVGGGEGSVDTVGYVDGSSGLKPGHCS